MINSTVGYGFLWIVSEAFYVVRGKEGLGMGDIKLLGMTGALFGLECVFYTIFVGSVIGSVVGLVPIVLRLKKFSQPIPFGPFLALAAALYVFTGNELVMFATQHIMTALGLVPG